MAAGLQVIALLLAPALAYALAKRMAPARWLGPVGVCYALGILAANIPGLPLDGKVSSTIAEAAVPLSIPLLLFVTDVPRWLKLARPALISFGLASAASMTSALFFGTWLLPGDREGIAASGMLAAGFIGGTPNLNAVGMALGVPQELYLLVNAADVLVGGVYLLFLLTVAAPLARKILPAWRAPEGLIAEDATGEDATPRVSPRDVLIALGLSVLCAALSVGGTLAVYRTLAPIPILLGVSTLGLVFSFIPFVRRLQGTFEAGEYAMLVFCAAIGTLVNVGTFSASSGVIVVLVAAILVGAVLVHFMLARLFRIDADTALITSTATIFGPPFIAPVARALGNREVVASGITLALAGFAIGTWLGLLTAWILGA